MAKDNISGGMPREQLEQKLKGWEDGELAETVARQPESRDEYNSASGLGLKRVVRCL